MNRIAKFEKVSYDQWVSDMCSVCTSGCWEEVSLRNLYDNITLPTRATTGSSGYDFKSPFHFKLSGGQTITIPTGIRVRIDDGWWLMCMPKSGLGFKYRAQLDNTIGNIDSDYYYSDNEGHIMAKLTNDTWSDYDQVMEVDAGKGFMQGVFVPYGITVDDDATGIRNGGFGSTEK